MTAGEGQEEEEERAATGTQPHSAAHPQAIPMPPAGPCCCLAFIALFRLVCTASVTHSSTASAVQPTNTPIRKPAAAGGGTAAGGARWAGGAGRAWVLWYGIWKPTMADECVWKLQTAVECACAHGPGRSQEGQQSAAAGVCRRHLPLQAGQAGGSLT